MSAISSCDIVLGGLPCLFNGLIVLIFKVFSLSVFDHCLLMYKY